MDYHIKAIALDEQFEKYTVKSAQKEGGNRLSNLSKINIFVGENNSGKSKFLRHLAVIEKLQFVPHFKLGEGWTWEMLGQVAEEFRTNVNQCFRSQEIQEADGILQQLASI